MHYNQNWKKYIVLSWLQPARKNERIDAYYAYTDALIVAAYERRLGRTAIVVRVVSPSELKKLPWVNFYIDVEIADMDRRTSEAIERRYRPKAKVRGR